MTSTFKEKQSERIKRGIRAAHERRMNAAVAQAEYSETFLQSPQP